MTPRPNRTAASLKWEDPGEVGSQASSTPCALLFPVCPCGYRYFRPSCPRGDFSRVVKPSQCVGAKRRPITPPRLQATRRCYRVRGPLRYLQYESQKRSLKTLGWCYRDRMKPLRLSRYRRSHHANQSPRSIARDSPPCRMSHTGRRNPGNTRPA